MKVKAPKEDPADRRARLRERRISMFEQAGEGQEMAKSIGADLSAVYGIEHGKNVAAPPVKRRSARVNVLTAYGAKP